MSEYTIEFNNVSKKYSKKEVNYTLRDFLSSMGKKKAPRSSDELREDEFWAVKNLSFKLKKGEVLGIIGPNGAGKSTALKMLSGITVPTHGTCHATGRVSAIIEVTAGFHPDFTGRENIYFNGTILGMTRKEIDAKFEKIVDFSGVRSFIDTPVKYYSSGMGARLGFAVASHVDPDVLLVDEVLSVGDIAFKAKCTEKMREMLNSGITIVFVSHNVALVQNLCSRVILLDKGEVLKDGKAAEVVPYYAELMNNYQEEGLKKIISYSEQIQDQKDNLAIKIINVRTTDSEDKPKDVFNSDEPITVDIDYETSGILFDPVFVIQIIRQDNTQCCYFNSKDAGFSVGTIESSGTLQLKLPKTALTQGVYIFKIEVWDHKMIYPYIAIKKGIFKIVSDLRHEYAESVFLLNADWSKK